MNRYLTRIKKSEFIRNSIISISGSSIAQIIPIFSAPVLTRLYTPNDYGILGVYMSLAGLAGIIATFQYHNAILIPKDEEDAFNLVRLCVRNTIITSVISLLLIVSIGRFVLEFIHAENVLKWLPLLPLSVFATGLNATFLAYANRNKLFKIASFNRIFGALSTLIVSLTFGYYAKGESGLLFGLLIGQLVNGVVLTFRVVQKKGIRVKSLWNFNGLYGVKKQFANFPKYSLPTDFINNFTNQIPVFMITAFAGQSFTGLFNMCNRLLSVPQIFLSSAVGDVFRQRATHDFNHLGSLRTIFLKTAKTLIFFSLLPFLILLLWGPDLFAFFLGEQWRESGIIARIMAPLFLLRFVNSPLSYIFYILGKLKLDLYATIYLNITTVAVLYLTFKSFSIYAALIAYSVNYSLVYIFMLNKSNQLSKVKMFPNAVV